jgi:hypothetical protein
VPSDVTHPAGLIGGYKLQFGRQRTSSPHWGARLGAIAVVAALAIISLAVDAGAEPKKHYWATSLTGSVDGELLRGLREELRPPSSRDSSPRREQSATSPRTIPARS